MATLELGSPEELAAWLSEGDDQVSEADPRLVRALGSAREIVTFDTNPALVGDAPYPESLHLATLLKAAQMYGRRLSTYGVEALGLGGEAGGFLSFDPHYRELIRPWAASSVGTGPITA